MYLFVRNTTHTFLMENGYSVSYVLFRSLFRRKYLQNGSLPKIIHIKYLLYLKMARILPSFCVLIVCFSAIAQAPQRYDVVLHEIMADPSPALKLPEAEYVEIRNRSGKTIALSGWRLLTRSATSGMFPNASLPPDSLMILCAPNQVPALQTYGRVLAIPAFPSLLNEGTLLSLVSKEGRLVHAVDYSVAWYRHKGKESGGWSLEMIDGNDACAGRENWMASDAADGGTPGRPNSVGAQLEDRKPPELLHAFFADRNNLVLVFNETIDSVSALAAGITSLPSLAFATVTPFDPLHRTLRLQLAAPADSHVLYRLTVEGIQDCRANRIQENSIRSGIPGKILPGDLVVNEILYHPKPGGQDYVELINRSNKIADLSQLFIGTANTLQRITGEPRYLLPGAYVAFTPDTASLARQYAVPNTRTILAMPTLPSFPNESGTVAVANIQGTVIDEVTYHKHWQFRLLATDEGVALERINPMSPSQDAANWHSAAHTAGYGTPGYKNSQFRSLEQVHGTLSVTPKIFSPDGDGRNDLAMIRCQPGEGGYAANVFVYSSGGVMVRHLVKNALLGTEGSWPWDGLDEKGKQLAPGPYIILASLFNLQGEKQNFKKVVVIGRR